MSAIPEQRSNRIKVGVLAGVLLLLIVSLVWNWAGSASGNVKPLSRNAGNFMATWRCLSCGHELDDAGDRGGRECPKCGKKEMYVRFRYTCREHGEYLVAFNYNDKLKPDQVKVGDGPWVPYFDPATNKFGFSCPKCGRMLDVAEAPRAALKPGDVEEPEVPPDQQQPAGEPKAGG